MAISKNSVRVQFTLNLNKHKENQIAEFLNGCMDQNNSIKEIIYNYMVSNSEYIDKNIVSNSDEKSHEASELEMNELEELSKFI